MPFPLLALGIGAAAGLLKSALIDQPAADRQRKVEATKALTQPFTGIPAGQVKEDNPFGEALSMGLVGANLQQQANALDAQEKILADMNNNPRALGAVAGANPFMTQTGPSNPFMAQQYNVGQNMGVY